MVSTELQATAISEPLLTGDLQLINVTKTYVSPTQTVTAVEPFSLKVQQGEFVILFGPSGCGKSTLLNIIAGFERPTAGEVILDGQQVEGPHFDRLMLFQEHALFPWLNVVENVMFGLRRQFRFRARARRKEAQKYLEMVHLEEFARASIHELSGGMKQRVALARALAPDPKVLLVDEPFPALDALTRGKLYGDLQEIFLRTRKMILLVTHDPREAACLGDRVVVLSDRPGRIKAEIAIDLPRPREINDPRIGEYATKILGELGPSARDNSQA